MKEQILVVKMLTGLLSVKGTEESAAEPYSLQQLGSSQKCLPMMMMI